MPRFFLEVAYKGTAYRGFQVQQNANTIQAEVEKALKVLLSPYILFPDGNDGSFLTGSSRTDAGVHALQNFFHFDAVVPIQGWLVIEGDVQKLIYKLNAILPSDIVIKNLFPVTDETHSRFNANSREYRYYIYQKKNPFLQDRAFYFPYKLDIESMQEAATILKQYTDFTSFSKRNTQVKTFHCQLLISKWEQQDECLVYNVLANRFLRGMVRGLTATMLQVGRGKLSMFSFRKIIEAKDCTLASFAVPAHGLFLTSVSYSLDF